MDLLKGSELDAALRRKMTEWDREIAVAENDLANSQSALEECFGIKRRAVRGEASAKLGTRKTG